MDLTSHFVKLNTIIMAFRNHVFRPPVPPVQSVVERSLKSSFIDGVETFVPVDVDTSQRPPLPTADEYRLSALLASGAPLNHVSPTIFENVELDAEHFVTENLTDDVSRETVDSDDNETNLNND
jgi:hypothetical protein